MKRFMITKNSVMEIQIHIMIHKSQSIKLNPDLTHLHGFQLLACAAVIIHRNHFFCLYQQNKSSESKVKYNSDRLVIVAKGPNLHMVIKQKSPVLLRNLTLGTLGKLLIVFSTKVNLLYLLYSTAQRCYLLHLIKQNCLLKTIIRTLILMTWVSLYLFSLLELV